MVDISKFNNFFKKFTPKIRFCDQKAINMEGMNIFYNPRCLASIFAQLCALFSKTSSYSSGIWNTLFLVFGTVLSIEFIRWNCMQIFRKFQIYKDIRRKHDAVCPPQQNQAQPRCWGIFWWTTQFLLDSRGQPLLSPSDEFCNLLCLLFLVADDAFFSPSTYCVIVKGTGWFFYCSALKMSGRPLGNSDT